MSETMWDVTRPDSLESGPAVGDRFSMDGSPGATNGRPRCQGRRPNEAVIH